MRKGRALKPQYKTEDVVVLCFFAVVALQYCVRIAVYIACYGFASALMCLHNRGDFVDFLCGGDGFDPERGLHTIFQ